MQVLAGGTIEAPVEHPDWDAVFGWVLDDGDNLLFFSWSEGSGAAEWVKASTAGDGMSEAAANTGDSAEGEVKWLTAIDVGREHTNHVTESRRVGDFERHD